MFTSGRRPRSPRALKTALVYLLISGLCVLVNYVYSLYGHGVSSAAMSLMFLYPLLGGALVFALVWLLMPGAQQVPHYRLSVNLYNAGIAALTVGSLLKGVFDIAGTSSPYIVAYRLAGWLLAGAGAILYVGSAAALHIARE